MPARTLRAPAELNGVDPGALLFLAGGVSQCPDWQTDMILRLAPALDGWTLVNPRLARPPRDPAAVEAEIAWEFRHLHGADAVLFWLTPPTPCPVSLYELGKVSMTTKPLFVGVHPEFPLRSDVVVQTRLTRPDARVVDSLDDLAGCVLEALTRR
ncbi:MAG: nucleoside 2-deoxyribosyltransferase domain-containing protein [Planctomycetota bacterium]|nr:nucleoside 2-deoxyribosyltransferase domain-containing protein [Planctomycetota bacterium]